MSIISFINQFFKDGVTVTINMFILLNICIRLNYNDISQGKIRTTNTYK